MSAEPVTDPTDPFARAERVADALLWEGYVLYPYRASAAKNQVRFQFGVLVPQRQSAVDGFERWSMRTECLAEFGLQATVDVRIRFLQVQARTVEQAVDGAFVPVAELEAQGELWASWDEAVEQVIDVEGVDLSRNGVRTVPFALAASRSVESLGDAGRVVRECSPVEGIVRVESAHSPGPYPLTKVRVSVENTTDWCDPAAPRSEVMHRSLVAVHTLLHVQDASFVSLLDPPEFARAAVEDCSSEGTYPVLVGDPADPSVVLSSPIIISDHPEVAAESPGDMFDATEIDEILALRILTLTDDEKRLARSTDPRAAAIVDRIEAFSPEVFGSLHGEMRPVSSFGGGRNGAGGSGPAEPDALPWWEPAVDAAVNPWEDSILIGGVEVAKGSRVRLRPGQVVGRRTDAQDLFLVGREGTVEGVFFDVDGDQHVAVVVDDDAAELHEWRGRFMYFHPDEVEPLP
ncbi:MAG: hypothetical protein JWN46_3569 [Acidimicrobiales bacterium]|nr:hypothetical protein [Acidimicrobiales bacterium]